MPSRTAGRSRQPFPSALAPGSLPLPCVLAACLLVACSGTDAARAEGTGAGAAGYPAPLRGRWILQGVACPPPQAADSDSLIVVGQDAIVRYEDASRAVRVHQLSVRPAVWAIDSLLDVAGGGVGAPVTEVFVLGDTRLSIVGRDGAATYERCD